MAAACSSGFLMFVKRASPCAHRVRLSNSSERLWSEAAGQVSSFHPVSVPMGGFRLMCALRGRNGYFPAIGCTSLCSAINRSDSRSGRRKLAFFGRWQRDVFQPSAAFACPNVGFPSLGVPQAVLVSAAKDGRAIRFGLFSYIITWNILLYFLF